MKLCLAVSFVVLCAWCVAAADDSVNTAPQTVTYCQLLANPSAYLGKRVAVRAIYKYGFEVQVLRSPVCCSETEPKFGVEFNPEMDDYSQRLFHKLDKGMGMALAVFVGKFERVKNASSQLPSGPRFRLSVDRIEKVEKSVRWRGSDPVWVPTGCGARIRG